MTMVLVQTVTVGSGGAADIEFTNIPQDATDLMVVISSRVTAATLASDGFFYINNSNNGYVRFLTGNSSTVSGNGYNNSLNFWGGSNGANATSNTFANVVYYFTNYTSSVMKHFMIDAVTETNNGGLSTQTLVGGYFDTSSPITSLKFDDGTYVQHTTASLYKITKA